MLQQQLAKVLKDAVRQNPDVDMSVTERVSERSIIGRIVVEKVQKVKSILGRHLFEQVVQRHVHEEAFSQRPVDEPDQVMV